MGVLGMEHDGVNIGIFEIVLKSFLLYYSLQTLHVTGVTRYRRYTLQSAGTMHAACGIRRAACGSFALNAAAGKIRNVKYKCGNYNLIAIG